MALLRTRLLLHSLEHRVVPTTFTVTNLSDAGTGADFLAFRTDYLLTNVPNSAFDFDGAGVVDASDFLQFRNRYLLTYLV